MDMIIDGWSIRNANADLRRFDNINHSLGNNSEWQTGATTPVFHDPTIGWQRVKLEIMVKGNDYFEICKNRGTILSKLAKAMVDVEIKGYKNKFILTVDKVADPDKKNMWNILALEMVGYEYGKKIVSTNVGATQIVINNIGNMDTPVTIKVYPTEETADDPHSKNTYYLSDTSGEAIVDENGIPLVWKDMSINNLWMKGVFGEDENGEQNEIVMNDIRIGSEIIIDGETGAITMDGESKIEDCDIWELPTLKPGKNVIDTNGSGMRIVIEYEPRYM